MLDALPDDGQRYEIIDGVLYVTPSPAVPHQDIVLALASRLQGYLDSNGIASSIGKVLVSPSDVRRGDRTRNRVQPDVYVVRRVDGKRPPVPYDVSDLLLAVEVVSPSSALHDYQRKRDLYLREGVGEYWVVNVDAENVSRWTTRDEPGEVLSQTLTWHPVGMTNAFTIDLPSFFRDALA